MSGCLPPTSQCMNLELITRFTSTGFGSTIQDFFQTFFKTIISFSRLEVIIKQLINTGLKKHWKKLFSWCTANVWARLKKIWPKRKKFHLIQSTCCSFEKKSKSWLYTIFFRFYIYYLDFFQVWKIAVQISGLSLEFIVHYVRQLLNIIQMSTMV